MDKETSSQSEQPVSEISKKLAHINFPILVLDKNWYNMFENIQKTQEIIDLEAQLNSLLKDQGRVTNELKELKVKKKVMVNKIMNLTEQAFGDGSSAAKKEMEKSQKAITDINKKLEELEDKLPEIERDIKVTNAALLEQCVTYSYSKMRGFKHRTDILKEQILKLRALTKNKIAQKEYYEQSYRKVFEYLKRTVGDDVMRIMDEEYMDGEQKES